MPFVPSRPLPQVLDDCWTLEDGSDDWVLRVPSSPLLARQGARLTFIHGFAWLMGGQYRSAVP